MNEHHSLLLVEDNADDVFFMKRALKSAEISNHLQVASDGKEAIDYLQGNGKFANRDQFPLPCLLFLDLKLPHCSGHEVMDWICKQDQLKHLVVLILTTSKERRDIDLAYKCGANAYLVKPSSPTELNQIMLSVKDFWLKFNHYPSNPQGEPACSTTDPRS